MKHGDRCIYRYCPSCHTEDDRDQAELQGRDGQPVTVLRCYFRELVLVHDQRGGKFYAEEAELEPVPQTITPAGKQEELFT